MRQRKMKKYKYNPDYAVAPGTTFYETWQEMGWPKAYVCSYLNLTAEQLNDFIDGKSPVSKEFAELLEKLTNISCEMWMKMEKNYQDRK